MVRRWYGDGGGRGRGSIVCAQGGRGGATGGGIFALRRPRPYSRYCGEGIAGYGRRASFTPAGRPCAPIACQSVRLVSVDTSINGNGVEGDHDAARRYVLR